MTDMPRLQRRCSSTSGGGAQQLRLSSLDPSIFMPMSRRQGSWPGWPNYRWFQYLPVAASKASKGWGRALGRSRTLVLESRCCKPAHIVRQCALPGRVEMVGGRLNANLEVAESASLCAHAFAPHFAHHRLQQPTALQVPCTSITLRYLSRGLFAAYIQNDASSACPRRHAQGVRCASTAWVLRIYNVRPYSSNCAISWPRQARAVACACISGRQWRRLVVVAVPGHGYFAGPVGFRRPIPKWPRFTSNAA
jgi:hypothetical protein